MDEIKAYEIIQKYPEVKDMSCVYVLPNNYKETKELNEALNYLFLEWDYGVMTVRDYRKMKIKQWINSKKLFFKKKSKLEIAMDSMTF